MDSLQARPVTGTPGRCCKLFWLGGMLELVAVVDDWGLGEVAHGYVCWMSAATAILMVRPWSQ